MKKQTQQSIQFSKLIKELADQNIPKYEIAEKLGILKPNSTLGDNSVMTKLCNGTLKSFKGTTVEGFTSKLLTHKDFAPILTSRKIDASKFDLLFFFYYWSAYDELKLGLLGIVAGKLSECKFYYLQKDPNNIYVEKYTLEVKSITYENSETLDIIVSKKHTGATYISAHLGNKEIDEIEVSFCSYCGAMGALQKPYAGIGLLEKVKKNDFARQMDEINSNGIPHQIINALYKRRFDLSNREVEIYDSIESINITQKEPLKLVSGQWLGYYLERQIEGPEESGGIVKVLMDVEESGITNIYFKDSDDPNIKEFTVYKGFFKFPFHDSGAIIIGEFESQTNINRLILHLKPDAQKLKGVFTGYRSIDLGYFTSPIYFEKLYVSKPASQTKNDFISSLADEHKPARYHRSQKNSYSQDIIDQLQRIQDKTFDTVHSCLATS
jgi:hypothetical protein